MRVLMKSIEVLVQPAMLCSGVRLGVKVLMQSIEIMVETLVRAGPQAGHQNSGQREAEQERFFLL